MYSQTYVGVLVMLLSVFLPKAGVNIGEESLTTTLSTIFTIAGGLWAFWGRFRAGNVSLLGFKKN